MLASDGFHVRLHQLVIRFADPRAAAEVLHPLAFARDRFRIRLRLERQGDGVVPLDPLPPRHPDVVHHEDVVDAVERLFPALFVVARRFGTIGRARRRQPLGHRLGGLLPLRVLTRKLRLALAAAPLFQHALPAIVFARQRRIALHHLHRFGARPPRAIELPLALRLDVDVRPLALVVRLQTRSHLGHERLQLGERAVLGARGDGQEADQQQGNEDRHSLMLATSERAFRADPGSAELVAIREVYGVRERGQRRGVKIFLIPMKSAS